MKLDYLDIIVFLETIPSTDGFASDVSIAEHEVGALFVANSGFTRGSHTSDLTSTASAYIDIDNTYIQDNAYRLEGNYVLANPFNADDAVSWYRITQVNVGQDKLLANKIDNVEIFLKKSTRPNNVS